MYLDHDGATAILMLRKQEDVEFQRLQLLGRVPRYVWQGTCRLFDTRQYLVGLRGSVACKRRIAWFEKTFGPINHVAYEPVGPE